jgi:hypothetical protein
LEGWNGFDGGSRFAPGETSRGVRRNGGDVRDRPPHVPEGRRKRRGQGAGSGSAKEPKAVAGSGGEKDVDEPGPVRRGPSALGVGKAGRLRVERRGIRLTAGPAAHSLSLVALRR